MKRIPGLIFFLFFIGKEQFSFAQNDSVTVKHKIAIFAPLYLDSAFDAVYNYRYDKTFPKFINPGLEFYEGAQLALDSMANEGSPLEVFIYDTRSSQKPVSEMLKSPELDSVELIIAHCSGQELGTFAYAAALKKVPFVNVNLPIDGGVNNNAYFVMLNPTLKTHAESIYKYIQKNYPLYEIVVVRKKGQMEDLIKSYFDEAGKTTSSVPLKIRYIDLVDSFSVNQLKKPLDSTRKTLVIAGSLDENFGRRLAVQLASIAKQYPVALFGMPTFDNISKDFSRPEFKGLEIVYSTPFYNARTDRVSVSLTNYFATKMYARPSDMVMRGYEAVWRFSKLLIKYKSDLAANIMRKEFNVFREFNIEPVISKQSMNLDYFENKKLFFIKWTDGLIKGVN